MIVVLIIEQIDILVRDKQTKHSFNVINVFTVLKVNTH